MKRLYIINKSKLKSIAPQLLYSNDILSEIEKELNHKKHKLKYKSNRKKKVNNIINFVQQVEEDEIYQFVYPLEYKVSKPIFNKYEIKILDKVRYILSSDTSMYSKVRSLGSIKGKIFNNKRIVNKDKIISEIISIISLYNNIRWDSLRDSNRMRKYRRTVYMCERCKVNKATCTHHITPPNHDGPSEQYSNYMSLCDVCHSIMHPDISVELFNTKHNIRYIKKRDH